MKDDDTQTIDYNGKGNATIGEANNLAVATNYVMDGNTRIWPVTLTKVFKVKKDQKANYRVLVVRDFRREHFSQSGFCNLNGGSLTITFMPDR